MATLIYRRKRLALRAKAEQAVCQFLLEDLDRFSRFQLSDGCVGPRTGYQTGVFRSRIRKGDCAKQMRREIALGPLCITASVVRNDLKVLRFVT